MTTHAPFPVSPELTQIALAYKNPDYIADLVLPRAPVGKQSFKYLRHKLEEALTIPDTTVGRKGRPNEVEFSASEEDSSTRDYGLEFPVPQADIENAKQPNLNYDPLGRGTEMLSELIMLDREKRAADLVFASATHTNADTLSGTTQWSDYTNSNPTKAIMAALDECLIRPNVMVIGQEAWTVLRQHPKVVKATANWASDTGVAARQAIADLLEIEEVLVGTSRRNSAKPGQTASLVRLWGKHCAFIYRNRQAMPEMGLTFGLTAQWGGKIAGSWEDKNIGLRGGQRVRVGESVREVVMSTDVSYFFENCTA